MIHITSINLLAGAFQVVSVSNRWKKKNIFGTPPDSCPPCKSTPCCQGTILVPIYKFLTLNSNIIITLYLQHFLFL